MRLTVAEGYFFFVVALRFAADFVLFFFLAAILEPPFRG
jgi:hypothetical protein